MSGESFKGQGGIHIDSLDQLDQSGFMVREVGAYEAKTHFSQLLKQVEEGETVYITRHGKRVAELHPAKPRKKAKFGCAKGPGFYMAPDFDEPLEDFKAYME